eukprot:SAG22_NODE_130_length_18670_cov_12.091379_4_plen_207_part_00
MLSLSFFLRQCAFVWSVRHGSSSLIAEMGTIQLEFRQVRHRLSAVLPLEFCLRQCLSVRSVLLDLVPADALHQRRAVQGGCGQDLALSRVDAAAERALADLPEPGYRPWLRPAAPDLRCDRASLPGLASYSLARLEHAFVLRTRAASRLTEVRAPLSTCPVLAGVSDHSRAYPPTRRDGGQLLRVPAQGLGPDRQEGGVALGDVPG